MSRIRPTSPTRFAVIVDEQVEVAIPLPPGRGQRIDLLVERQAAVRLVPGSVNVGRPLLPDGWTAVGYVHIAEGQVCVQEHHIEVVGAPAAERWPVPAGMPCAHLAAVPVSGVVDGELLAALCPRCDAQLPADWLACRHESTVGIASLGERPGKFLCNDCGGCGWEPTTVEAG